MCERFKRPSHALTLEPLAVVDPREIVFCHKYAATGNQSQSAKDAGYTPSGAASQARRLLQREDIQEYVRQLVEEKEQLKRVTATQVILELAKVAFFDFAEMVDCLRDNGSLDEENWSTEARAAVSSIKVTRTYEGEEEDRQLKIATEIKTWDRLRALKMLGDHVGAFTDLNMALATLRTYGIELVKMDGEWVVLRDGERQAVNA